MELCEVVELRGGLTVPLEVLRVAWALEARGYVFEDHGDRLNVRRGTPDVPPLTDEDREQVKRWKGHLLAVLAYQPVLP